MSKTSASKVEDSIFKIELGVFLRTCEAVGTARALCCYMLAVNGEWEQYLELQPPDPLSSSFTDDYLVTEMLTKNPLLPTSINRRLAALMKWFEAEDMCNRTNKIFSAYEEGRLAFGTEFENVLTRAIKIVADILGPLDRKTLELVEAGFRFGPGATSSCSGIKVVPSRKMISRLDITPGLYPYWRSLITPVWGRSVPLNINLRAYNKVTFVSKNAKTDRAIAVEPHLNVYVQLGIGRAIRYRLRRAGLDLDNQADDNRQRAKNAYRDGWVTIDLSSASDTIAMMIVKLLLPPDWFALLDLARCEYSVIDNMEIRLQKFSSMGNGFTFELESLIFYALAKACGCDDAVAFGDDIITSKATAPLLIRTLKTLGFKVNERKTCLAGTFFESCGADYNYGVNVRPFYLKGKYLDFTSCIIQVCNKIRIYAHNRRFGYGCDARFLRPWLFAVSRSDNARRTGISAGYGNDGLVRNLDEATPTRARHGHEGWVAKVWRGKPDRKSVV